MVRRWTETKKLKAEEFQRDVGWIRKNSIFVSWT